MSETDTLNQLRAERDAAALRGDHAEALILNDRIILQKIENSLHAATVRNAHVAEPFRGIVNDFSEPRK